MRFIQMFATQCSEGVLIVDLGQNIVWANEAALTLHAVATVADLGRTIDEYHTRFKVKYIALLPDEAIAADTSAVSSETRAQPDILMELVCFHRSDGKVMHRQRKLVLLDDAGNPSVVVLFIHRVAELACNDANSMVSNKLTTEEMSLDSMSELARLQRLSDRSKGALDVVAKDNAIGGISVAASVAQGTLSSLPSPVMLAALCPAAMHIVDENMVVVDVSQRWLEWLGYDREAVIGRKIFDFMPTSSIEHLERHTRHLMASTSPTRDLAIDFLTRSGDVVQAMVSGQSMQVGAALAGAAPQNLVAAVCVDVTAQRRSEDAVAAMFAAAPVPMLIRKCDDARIIDANDAFLKATEFNVSGIIGHNFDEFTAFETRGRKDQFEAFIRGNEPLEALDVGLKTAHGDMLDCMLSTTRIWAFGKQCVLLTLQDVSERRRTEAELMSAIDAVMKDSSWFGRSVVERLAAHRAPPKSGRRAAALGDLTPRERDVLSLISLGLPDAEIAERLGLTRSTIRNHLSTLYSKINVHNRGSAIIWARERCINITQLPARSKPGQPKFGALGAGPKKIMPLNQAGGWAQEAKSAAGD